MIKIILSLTLMLSFPIATAEMRKWTSADGSQSFQAKFIKIQGDRVTIIRNGLEKTFDMKILSEADQKWLAAIRQQQPLREWTSADGKETFMAEVVEVSGSSVTFSKNFSKITKELSDLSEPDQEWLKKNIDKFAKQEKQVASSGLASRLRGKTVKLKEGVLAEDDIEQAKFYVLYFTASW